jgi:hypothetical protein
MKNHKNEFVVPILLIIVVLIVIVSWFYNYKTDTSRHINPTVPGEDSVIGMLSVVTNCLIPEGCGPKYHLLDKNLNRNIILIGDFKDKDDGLIVRLSGTYIASSSEKYKKITSVSGANRLLPVMEVSSSITLSKIPYHTFLVEQAGKYSVAKGYVCPSKNNGTNNKSFSWDLVNEEPLLKVRMTNTFSEEIPKPFYELWYNGKTGDFIKEIAEPKPQTLACN